MTFLLTLLLSLTVSTGTFTADTTDAYRVYTGAGEPADLSAIIAAADTADALFIGEQHNDAVAHALQDTLLQRLHAPEDAARPIALSLEMFTRDVQYILDEYLEGQISEEHFLQSSRPWSNYRSDYHPLVEFARENDLAVIAANAPRRYANLVTRQGREALEELSAQAREALPPLPYPEPSEAYAQKWQQVMDQMPAHEAEEDEAPADTLAQNTRELEEDEDDDRHLDAQSLWDATMAYSMAEHYMRQPDALIMHLTGSFHVEDGLGTPEMLERYRPGTRPLVVVIRPVDDVTAFDERLHEDLADFVILTDASAPSSY